MKAGETLSWKEFFVASGQLAVAVASAGTAVPLSATSKTVNHFTIQASKTGASQANTGLIYIGDEDVGNATAGVWGVKLADQQSYSAPPTLGQNVYNLKDYFINADTSLDAVTVLFDEY